MSQVGLAILRSKMASRRTTPADQRNGVVNVVVGFAPLSPAEFIIITVTQILQQ